MTAALLARPAPDTTRPHLPAHWRCSGRTCQRFLGTVRDGVLFEKNGDKSHLPCVRHCPKCGKRNIRLN